MTSTSTGRHPGKRLSPWRVAIGVLIACALIAGVVVIPWYLFTSRPAVSAPIGPRWFGAYYDVTAADAADTSASSSASASDGVLLSFVVAASSDSCQPSWGGAYSLMDAGRSLDLDRRVEGMRREGAHVAISFGGAKNTELGTACSSVNDLANAYSTVIDRYSVSTVDLDLENQNLSDSAAGDRRAQALAKLQASRRADGSDLTVWLTLPVGLDGFTQDGLRAIRQLLQAGVNLAGVNAMTMDFNVPLSGKSMADAAIGALQGAHDQLERLYADQHEALPSDGAWGVLGATAMIGQNDVRGEVFTLKDAAKLNDFAQDQRLARLSMWSANRDRTCGPNYPDLTVVSTSCSGVDQGDASFAGTLRRGFSGLPGGDATPSASPTASLPDDAETAPYPLWTEGAAYSAGVRVVWHGYVYAAKWWVSGGYQPDDPMPTTDQTAWRLIGPVLPTDVPFSLPTAPAGTPVWASDQPYDKGAVVSYQGVPYRAKWWTRGDVPSDGITDHDRSPWAVVEDTAPTTTPSPSAGP
ncbi:carbohydrate-binding protein [uncultured Microbacterium sp.]|uniref:carbohydrate-binding protein n=1 Tax=uncultured Microbacterium sp. TaxID=191216 RepID=UPI0025CD19D3|nr:carbohydrate-binding protein [uncultured Microbacterium sp.]